METKMKSITVYYNLPVPSLQMRGINEADLTPIIAL
jgi:hypothetical protein